MATNKDSSLSLKVSTLDMLEAGGEQGRSEHLIDRMSFMLPEQIRVLREQRGWSQIQLAEATDKT